MITAENLQCQKSDSKRGAVNKYMNYNISLLLPIEFSTYKIDLFAVFSEILSVNYKLNLKKYNL